MLFNAYENSVVRPLFYDALSGEFTPDIDPQKRAHTLGRLMFATLSKGNRQLTDFDDQQTTHLYRPSWVPNVSAEVICMIDDADVPEYAEVSLVSLQHKDDWVKFIDATYQEEESSGIVTIDANGRAFYPLHLGDGLQDARLAVTSRAQQFFDTIQDK